MKRTKPITVFSCLLCIFVGVFSLSFPSPLIAAIFCVSNEADLSNALTIAKDNGEDDLVKVQQGTYNGNFIYASAEPNGLTIEGGYFEGCASRVVDPENTVLDAQETGRVLTLSAPDVDADLVIESLTIQNGYVKGDKNGAGLFLKLIQM